MINACIELTHWVDIKGCTDKTSLAVPVHFEQVELLRGGVLRLIRITGW